MSVIKARIIPNLKDKRQAERQKASPFEPLSKPVHKIKKDHAFCQVTESHPYCSTAHQQSGVKFFPE